MNEEYLQLIWNRARLPIPQLKLTNGKQLVVKKTGDHNMQFSGPDFYNACIQFDDLEFHGAIEIHVNSSDWYKHKHHLDESFNSVILHVVYNNDVSVVQNGLKLPTLELKPFLDPTEIIQFDFASKKKIIFPCKSVVDKVDDVYWNSMKTKALIHKWNEKTQPLETLSDEQALYVLIASSFGMGVNKKPFEELARIIPWSQLVELTGDQRVQLILVSSGWMNNNYDHGAGTNTRWHFRGTRPSNFPTKRIPQFAAFIAMFEINELVKLLECNDFLDQFHLLLKERNQSKNSVHLSRELIDSILINAFVPFLWRLSEFRLNYSYQEKAMDILNQLPHEKNGIIRRWSRLNVKVKSALDSQGLLALNRYFCTHKKCLSCEVGLKSLDRLV